MEAAGKGGDEVLTARDLLPTITSVPSFPRVTSIAGDDQPSCTYRTVDTTRKVNLQAAIHCMVAGGWLLCDIHHSPIDEDRRQQQQL